MNDIDDLNVKSFFYIDKLVFSNTLKYFKNTNKQNNDTCDCKDECVFPNCKCANFQYK